MEEVSLPTGTPAPATEAPAPAPQAEPKPGGINSEIRLAAQRLAQRREEVRKEREAAAQEPAPPPQESPPQEGDAAPAEEPSSGETEAVDPVQDEPPISPPRSWTSDDHEAFKALPREVQSRLVEIDRARELEVRRVQNEIAEQRRADEAGRAAMEQARQQYEASLAYTLQMAQGNEFADIKTIDDVTKLAHEDWPRYVQWDAHQKKIQMMGQEYQAAQDRQANEYAQRWQQFASQEDQKFSTKYPDANAIRDDAVNYLKKAGFSQDEMATHWNSGLWRDHRMQAVLRDAVLFGKAQKARAEAAKKPVPPVQRPGVAQARPSPDAATIKALEAKPSLTLKEAAELTILRGKSR